MFADLNLPLEDVEPALHRERLALLASRGYDAVAAVHTVTGRLSEADRATSTSKPLGASALTSASSEARNALALRSGAIGPLALAASSLPSTSGRGAAAPSGSAAGIPGGRGAGQQGPPALPLVQLTRLNVVASDAVQAAQLQPAGGGGVGGGGGGGGGAGPGGSGAGGAAAGGGSAAAGAVGPSVVRSYDVLSITPKSERVFQQACTSLDVDIISLDLAAQRLGGVKMRGPAVKAALKRGIHFEICYAPGLRESSARRNLFCNAQALVRATRGKNILLSSSARGPWEVRAPLDVLHMATLFGLTKQQAQVALTLAPRAVLARAAARAAAGTVPGSAAAPAAGAAALAAAGADAADVEMADARARGSGAASLPEQRPEAAAGSTRAAAKRKATR